jgi:glycerophosphoryl diester phosphodiesterase
MKSDIGVATAEIDVSEKYYKPAGFKGALKAHYEYIEEGRRPWLYRNGGASVLPFDKYMPYPRLCAHRGYNTVAPENTMLAFGAAVAMGAEEIEFDLWTSSDGVLVTAHDFELERVSDGHGNISELSFAELKKLDFGGKFSEKFKGLRIPSFEEILEKFAGRVIMNIHVKIWDENMPEREIEKIARLIEKYDCERHVYFMSVNTDALLEMRRRLPNAAYCHGAARSNAEMIELAEKFGFDKVQIVDWYPYDKSMIDRCHDAGIRCNFCQTQSSEEAKELFEMGIDCILTNDFHALKFGLEDYMKNKR